MAGKPPTTAQQQAASSTRLFLAALIAALLVDSTPLPWRLSGFGFDLVAAWAAVRGLSALARLRRAGQASPGWFTLTLGLGVVFLGLTGLIGDAAFYPLVTEHERCLAQALTIQGRHRCDDTFEERRQEIIDRLQGSPSPSR
jgi:hypothetical protein